MQAMHPPQFSTQPDAEPQFSYFSDPNYLRLSGTVPQEKNYQPQNPADPLAGGYQQHSPAYVNYQDHHRYEYSEDALPDQVSCSRVMYHRPFPTQPDATPHVSYFSDRRAGRNVPQERNYQPQYPADPIAVGYQQSTSVYPIYQNRHQYDDSEDALTDQMAFLSMPSASSQSSSSQEQQQERQMKNEPPKNAVEIFIDRWNKDVPNPIDWSYRALANQFLLTEATLNSKYGTIKKIVPILLKPIISQRLWPTFKERLKLIRAKYFNIRAARGKEIRRQTDKSPETQRNFRLQDAIDAIKAIENGDIDESVLAEAGTKDMKLFKKLLAELNFKKYLQTRNLHMGLLGSKFLKAKVRKWAVNAEVPSCYASRLDYLRSLLEYLKQVLPEVGMSLQCELSNRIPIEGNKKFLDIGRE